MRANCAALTGWTDSRELRSRGISPSAASPEGIPLRAGDKVIVPNYWGEIVPASLTGLTIEAQYTISNPHVAHVGRTPVCWIAYLDQEMSR